MLKKGTVTRGPAAYPADHSHTMPGTHQCARGVAQSQGRARLVPLPPAQGFTLLCSSGLQILLEGPKIMTVHFLPSALTPLTSARLPALRLPQRGDGGAAGALLCPDRAPPGCAVREEACSRSGWSLHQGEVCPLCPGLLRISSMNAHILSNALFLQQLRCL